MLRLYTRMFNTSVDDNSMLNIVTAEKIEPGIVGVFPGVMHA